MKNFFEPNSWDIWLARIDYEEIEGSKIRPILIIDKKAYMILSLKMTSHGPRNNAGEYQIKHWKEAGLNKPTVIRVSKRLTLPYELLEKRIGVLHDDDKENVKAIYEEIYHTKLDVKQNVR